MTIDNTTAAVFGQLALIEPQPDLGEANLNRAIAGFLAGYSGTTLVAYRLDLRQWIEWLDRFATDPYTVERAHIEFYARSAEQDGLARSTIGRRLSSVCGFYRYCEQERIIDRNPGAHVRRPKQDYESTTLGLDRNEVGAFLVQAGSRVGQSFVSGRRYAPRIRRSGSLAAPRHTFAGAGLFRSIAAARRGSCQPTGYAAA